MITIIFAFSLLLLLNNSACSFGFDAKYSSMVFTEMLMIILSEFLVKLNSG